MTRRIVLLFAALALLGTLAGPHAQARDPIVILISFDGWRWDYTDRGNVPNLKALAARGVRAKELIPSFPSLTFPNHYTIVTGLYPGHHGIVSNTMATPSMPRKFSMSSNEVRNAAWFGGEPVWATVIRQSRRAMSMFWPGSEAGIGGISPTRWWPFDGSLPNAERVSRVLDWLSLPEGERPAFVSLYFQEVDHIGHVNGPDSPEVREAAVHLDAALGQLVAGIDRLGLSDRVNIVVVSDHGMAPTTRARTIVVDDYISLERIEISDINPTLGVTPTPGEDAAGVYRALSGAHPNLTIYRREDTPEHWRFRTQPRVPPVVGVADEGWVVLRRAGVEEYWKRSPTGGQHGYDPALPSMHGIFVAAGPAFRQHLTVPAFENVHVYNALARAMRVRAAPNDGNPAAVGPLFR